jgi:hypothetical protein
LVVGTLLLAVWIAIEYPINTVFDEYDGPTRGADIAPVDVQVSGSVLQIYRRMNATSVNHAAQLTGDEVNLLQHAAFSKEESMWVPSGNIPLWRKERLVNGYTPIEMLSIKTLICGQSIFGWTCDGPGRAILQKERRTGSTYADLMRIEAFVVSTRMTESLSFFHQRSEWTASSPSRYATIFRRTEERAQLPGTVSYLPDGVRPVVLELLSDDHERITLLRSRDFRGGLVAFARPYYPGYSATIDGEHASIERLGGVVVAVEIPGGEGAVVVDVYHRLPKPVLWRLLVLVGLVFLASGIYLTGPRVRSQNA